MPKKKAGRKVTNADLFAPVEREQPEQQPRPVSQAAGPPRQQIQIPKEGEFNVKVRPDMAPPGVPQQTMLPISAGPGTPPVAMVPIAFVLPQGAQPGMEIKVSFKVIGPPQPLPQRMPRQATAMQPQLPEQRQYQATVEQQYAEAAAPRAPRPQKAPRRRRVVVISCLVRCSVRAKNAGKRISTVRKMALPNVCTLSSQNALRVLFS